MSSLNARLRLLLSCAFAVTMAYFEAAVVVYLKRLWELGEVDVANLDLSNRIVLTELIREAMSLMMIATVALLAGRGAMGRLGHGSLIFGIWDILYYAFLRLLIGWPVTILDWDVLFLIPRPWVGPVLAPVLVSVALITCGATAALREEGARPLRPRPLDWLAGALGGAIVILSFLMVAPPKSPADMPDGFSWPVFLLGLAMAVAGFFRALARASKRGAS